MSHSSEHSFVNSSKLYYENQHAKLLMSENTILMLKKKIVQLENKINNLSKENYDLKTKNAINNNAEIELSNAQLKIKELEEKNYNIMEKNYKEKKNLENEIDNLNLINEKEKIINRKAMSVFNQRREIINQIEMENRVNKEEIKNLKKINEDLKNENEEKLLRQEIRNQIKYTQLKKRMTENLKEAKKNITKLNVEYMDVNNRITILQNNQLMIQLELQFEKIEELEKNNQLLKDKIKFLENELEIHKNVEIKLAKKVHNKNSLSQEISFRDFLSTNYSNFNNISSNNNNINNNNNNIANNKLFSASTKNNNKSLLNYQEKKIFNLEKDIKNKNYEIENLKSSLEEYKIKLFKYEKKYSGLFNFFEDCLNKFYKDKEIKKNKNFYVNIESIKKCDFKIFSKEEQYSLLILIMKYLLPIINLNFNASCNIGNDIFETNLNVINKDFNKTQNFLKDPILKFAFSKNNNFKNIHSSNITSFNNKSIPIMKKEKNKQDNRLNNIKFKAVF